MVVLRALKDIISVKIKTRHDSPCDQFSRLLMTKMLFISAVLMGFDYFTDKIHCILPKDITLDKDFVNAMCWISGFFVYEEMPGMSPQFSIHYGLPKVMTFNGIDKKKNIPCSTTESVVGLKDEDCEPMTRVVYSQYQWMPFYIGALGVLFYFPYIVFRIVNVDLVSLKTAMKSISSEPDQLVKNYFNYKINPLGRLRLRVFLNVLVKCFYLAVNLFAFYFTDYLLYNKFVDYGNDYYDWAKTNSSRFKHLPSTVSIKRPGEKLLPSMGFCAIDEISKMEITEQKNKYLLLCEFSTNIMYQYVLIVLWVMFIVSICVSIIGLLAYIGGHLFPALCYTFGSPKHAIYRHLTLREIEYLQFIQKKDMVLYGEVLRNLKQHRIDLQGKLSEDLV